MDDYAAARAFLTAILSGVAARCDLACDDRECKVHNKKKAAKEETFPPYTGLHELCQNKGITQASVLCAYLDANPHTNIDLVAGPDGMTPLALCCRREWQAGVRELLRRGADINAMVQEGKTVVQLAATANATAELKILLDEAARRGREYLKKTVNFTLFASPIYGITALHGACGGNGAAAAAIMLLDQGADADVRCEGGFTPLHLAVHAKHEACVVALIETGDADVNIAAENGDTPLHVAVRVNRFQSVDFGIVTLLLSAGARTDIPNAAGETARSLVTDNHVLAELLDTWGAINNPPVQPRQPTPILTEVPGC